MAGKMAAVQSRLEASTLALTLALNLNLALTFEAIDVEWENALASGDNRAIGLLGEAP